MKSTNFNLVRYDADEGVVFDWKEPRYIEDENGEQVQEHLYAKTLFIGGYLFFSHHSTFFALIEE